MPTAQRSTASRKAAGKKAAQTRAMNQNQQGNMPPRSAWQTLQKALQPFEQHYGKGGIKSTTGTKSRSSGTSSRSSSSGQSNLQNQ